MKMLHFKKKIYKLGNNSHKILIHNLTKIFKYLMTKIKHSHKEIVKD